RDWVREGIDTGVTFPLQFGRFTEEDNNMNRTFKGLIDDFRVYSVPFPISDVQLLYGNGYGDLSVLPTFALPRVVDAEPVNGEVRFNRGGQEVEVYGFDASDFSFTNGSVVGGPTRVSPGVYTFQLTLDNFNQDAVLSLPQGVLTDDPRYAQPNEAAQTTTRKMFRAVTRGDELLAWWPFDTDSLGGTTVTSQTPGADSATLFDAEVSPYGRFGKGVRFDVEQTDARMRHDGNGVDVVSNSWSMAAWFKNLIPPASSGRTTLFRSQNRQSNRDWDRYVLIRGSNRFLHSYDGADGNWNNRYRSSDYEMDPVALQGWHHIVAVSLGNRTRFYLDGVYVGDADRQEQSDVYYIGNSSDNELFAEYLDDVRIYGVSLNDVEIKAVYGGGFGDQFTSVRMED
ncbi:MAG: LamG-like jellyroll fold domain-containing protein, partial [Verrucomicrobiota bacterium]|nr:LamG-like jellyroll fold domain-containing protein [Verrucomicrobiota bacterium]